MHKKGWKNIAESQAYVNSFSIPLILTPKYNDFKLKEVNNLNKEWILVFTAATIRVQAWTMSTNWFFEVKKMIHIIAWYSLLEKLAPVIHNA